MKELRLLLALFLVSWQQVFAQEYNSLLKEQIRVQTNHEMYLAGESVYFNLECTNKGPDALSKIVYLELVDDAGVPRIQLIRDLQDGQLTGSFFIPSNLITGNYGLVAYTNWMKNDPSGFFIKYLSIINPFEPIGEEIFSDSLRLEEVTLKRASSTGAVDSTHLLVTLGATPPKNAFLSVKKLDERTRYTAPRNESFKYQKPANSNRMHLPELHGHILSGIIKDRNGKGVKATISLSNQSINSLPSFTSSLEDGTFHFILSRKHRVGKLILKTIPGAQIEISPPFISYHDQLVVPPLLVPASLKKWILQRAQYVQIEDNYFTEKYALIEPVKNELLLDYVESKPYPLDDYQRFPTIEDPIIEYIPEVNFKKQGEVKKFVLPDYLDQGQTDSLLVLLNNIPVDFRRIFSQNATYIEKITVYPKQIAINNYDFAEVIHFETFDRFEDKPSSQASIFDYSIPTYQPRDAFGSSSLPDYRDQLFWGSAPTQTEPIRIQKSMNTGDFLVEIMDLSGTVLESFVFGN